MDRLEFIPAFEAAIRSADPEKLAALRAIVRQQGGPDEFAKDEHRACTQTSAYTL